MSNIDALPNLSTWHRVPAGAYIPAGTPYYEACKVTGNLYYRRNEQGEATKIDSSCWTERPLRPTPPTAPASLIANVRIEGSNKVYRYGLLYANDCWMLASPDGGFRIVHPKQIESFDSGTCLFDEADKRDRLDADGDIVTWDDELQEWYWLDGGSRTTLRAATLAEYHDERGRIAGFKGE